MKHLLVGVLGYQDNDFEEIWEIRNALNHGGLMLSAKEYRRLHKVHEQVRLAIIKGMKQVLGLGPKDLPLASLKLGITDPLLIVHWEEPQPAP